MKRKYFSFEDPTQENKMYIQLQSFMVPFFYTLMNLLLLCIRSRKKVCYGRYTNPILYSNSLANLFNVKRTFLPNLIYIFKIKVSYQLSVHNILVWGKGVRWIEFVCRNGIVIAIPKIVLLFLDHVLLKVAL